MKSSSTEYLDFAKNLAYEAGEIMRKYFMTSEREWKSDSTPVTLADTEINSLVIERVAASYPDHSILGEEESSNLGQRYTWVCDPVDGTMPYSHGLPISTFSLALCDDGQPIVGVVYDPFMDRLYWAEKDQGAYCNGEIIRVNSQTLDNALVAMDGFPSTKPVIEVSDNLRTTFKAHGAKVVSMWSAVLPAALVAQGQFTASMLNLDQPQDPAAIKVIVEEAGGKVTDLYGNDQRYDQLTQGFAASNGIVHDEVIRLIQEAIQ